MLIQQTISIEFKPELTLYRDTTSYAHERVQDSIENIGYRNTLIERSIVNLLTEGAFNIGPPRDIKIGATVILPNVVQILLIREVGECLVINYVQELP